MAHLSIDNWRWIRLYFKEMMLELKADFHTHSSDDPQDNLLHSTEMLIDDAARQGFDVLALTCHSGNAVTGRLQEYARRKGILLIPGIELHVEGKHVLILNPDEEQARAETFEELRRLGKRNAALIAPHPYYPSGSSLGKKLVENIGLFDAIEYCTMYFRWIGFNGAAVRTARKYGLPLAGTSDTHELPICISTFSWVTAESATVEAVIEAIRKGRVRTETRPRTLKEGSHLIYFAVRSALEGFLENGDSGKTRGN